MKWDISLLIRKVTFCCRNRLVQKICIARRRAEVMKVTLKNEGNRELTVRPVVAVSLYGRG